MSEAAIIASKPKRSNYAEGGIVPGNSYANDKIQANVNSGEMILNAKQQKQLWETANGKGNGAMQLVNNVYIGTKQIATEITQLFYDGESWVPQFAVSPR